MKALCWHGKNDIRCDSVPDPKIEDPRDVIIKVTACAICGSDLHLMDGMMPTMKSGDVLGHEFMGEVVEVGSGFTKFKKGDKIVVPFNINCGECRQCKLGQLFMLPTLQPQRVYGGGAVRLHDRWPVRIFAHDRRLRRRPGRICARAHGRRCADEGSGRPQRRRSSFSLRHLSHRLSGRRASRN